MIGPLSKVIASAFPISLAPTRTCLSSGREGAEVDSMNLILIPPRTRQHHSRPGSIESFFMIRKTTCKASHCIRQATLSERVCACVDPSGVRCSSEPVN